MRLHHVTLRSQIIGSPSDLVKEEDKPNISPLLGTLERHEVMFSYF